MERSYWDQTNLSIEVLRPQVWSDTNRDRDDNRAGFFGYPSCPVFNGAYLKFK